MTQINAKNGEFRGLFATVLPAFFLGFCCWSSAESTAVSPAHSSFGRATAGITSCPAPLGPELANSEFRKEAHSRAERGTSCFQSGRCRLPNSYSYDAEIYPRAIRFVQQDERFKDTSVWLTVKRRWIVVEGCVRNIEQGLALEATLKLIDDVETVVGSWMIGSAGPPPYATKQDGRQ